MKQFPFYLLLASMLLALPLRAQEKKGARLVPLINFEVIDTAQLKATYRYDFVGQDLHQYDGTPRGAQGTDLPG